MKTYETSDLGLAAYLYVCGFELTTIKSIEGEARKMFVFKHTDAIETHEEQFFSRKGSVEPRAFFNAIRDVKHRLYND